MTIRTATRADETAIQDVIRTSYELLKWGWFPEGYHKDLFDIEAHYFALGNEFLVAEIEGAVVATAAVDFFPRIPGSAGVQIVDGVIRIAGADCSLERLYVHPSARRKGLGKALWLRTIELAQARGCTRMEIWSDKLLHAAHEMYKGSGAIVCGERLCHDPDQSPEWGMSFDL